MKKVERDYGGDRHNLDDLFRTMNNPKHNTWAMTLTDFIRAAYADWKRGEETELLKSIRDILQQHQEHVSLDAWGQLNNNPCSMSREERIQQHTGRMGVIKVDKNQPHTSMIRGSGETPTLTPQMTLAWRRSQYVEGQPQPSSMPLTLTTERKACQQYQRQRYHEDPTIRAFGAALQSTHDASRCQVQVQQAVPEPTACASGGYQSTGPGAPVTLRPAPKSAPTVTLTPSSSSSWWTSAPWWQRQARQRTEWGWSTSEWPYRPNNG